MSNPNKTASRSRPRRCGTVSHFKMTSVDIDRIARTVATKLRESTLREAYLVHSASYYATSRSCAEAAGIDVVLVPPRDRPSYCQFRYWVAKLRRASRL